MTIGEGKFLPTNRQARDEEPPRRRIVSRRRGV